MTPAEIEGTYLHRCVDERRWRNLRPAKFLAQFEAEVAGALETEPVSEIFECDLPHFGACSVLVLTTGYVVLTNARGRMSLYESAARCLIRDNVAAWAEFSRGYWSKTPPTEPGLYYVTDLERGRQAVRELIRVDGKLRDTGGFLSPGQVTTWCGYWWSNKLPGLPSGKVGHVLE